MLLATVRAYWILARAACMHHLPFSENLDTASVPAVESMAYSDTVFFSILVI